jgi:hypothetical protein
VTPAPDDSPYAAASVVEDLSECAFYHTMALPGYGVVTGQWDLRAGLAQYLGNVDFAGKRVLELGTADGYLSFEIERQGASVVSFDLSEDDSWDVVPFARQRPAYGLVPSWLSDSDQAMKVTMRQLNNAYWLTHRAYDSSARLVLGSVYHVPPTIGPVDISVFGALLLHTRDPFGALRSSVELTRETVVVTDALGFFTLPAPLRRVRALLPAQLRRPIMRFYPDWRRPAEHDGWWRLSPEAVQAFLGVLGFERTEVTTHIQRYNGRPRRLFTVVGHRTVGRAVRP